MKANRLLLALGLLFATACAHEPRVGVIDVQQAFQRSPLVMVAAHQLKGNVGAAEREIKERGRALAELRQQVEHGGVELDAEQRREITTTLAEETTRLMELQARYLADLAEARERQGEAMIAQVEEMAREVARREGLTLLVRKDGILFTAEDANLAHRDITEQVARALLEKINPTEIPEP